MGKQSLLLLALASLLCLGCSNNTETPGESARQAPASAGGDTRASVRDVKSMALTLTSLPETMEAMGTVRSRQQSTVSSRLVARVVAVYVQVGDRVRAGQKLVDLDDSDLQAQVQRATAGLHEAQSGLDEVERAIHAAGRAIEAAQARADIAARTLQRYETLLARQSVAPQEYDEVAARHTAAVADVGRAREEQAALRAKKRQMQARITQAQAEVASARVTLQYTHIQAPISGIVTTRAVEVGNLASPGVVLCTLDEERYRLEAHVQEADSHRIMPGHQATVTLAALAHTVASTVDAIVPAADPLSRTVTVKLDLPTMPGLRSGMYGRAAFVIGQRQALLVPRQAIVTRGQLQGVFVVEADRVARLRLVTTGRTAGEHVEILSGLHAGERVLIEGVERVTEGSRVEEGAG